MITRGFSAETDLAVFFAGYFNRPCNHPFDSLVLLIEQISQLTRITIYAEGKLGQVVGPNGEVVKVVGEAGSQDHIRRDLAHYIDFETLLPSPEAVLGHNIKDLSGFFDCLAQRYHDDGISEDHLFAHHLDGSAFECESLLVTW
ncbi:hypothetical protein HZ326_26529 [Fusarium oxysporum f. sp. albedinis]|nr:hypothetical protein HZ326_26529 [Fusarium oxysporum f. sp. albedinis]